MEELTSVYSHHPSGWSRKRIGEGQRRKEVVKIQRDPDF